VQKNNLIRATTWLSVLGALSLLACGGSPEPQDESGTNSTSETSEAFSAYCTNGWTRWVGCGSDGYASWGCRSPSGVYHTTGTYICGRGCYESGRGALGQATNVYCW
jgi:hypothetical protein